MTTAINQANTGALAQTLGDAAAPAHGAQPQAKGHPQTFAHTLNKASARPHRAPPKTQMDQKALTPFLKHMRQQGKKAGAPTYGLAGGKGAAQAAQKASDDKHLGQHDYLKLMIAQFRNQDPTAPMKNGQFLGQLAEFGTVSGIKKLQKSFAALSKAMQSNQAFKAATLVGHKVSVGNSRAPLGQDGTLSGAVKVPASGGDVVVTITDSTGQQVQTIDLGQQDGGLVHFNWDGHTAKGKQAPQGTYSVSANLQGDGHAAKALPTLMSGRINSVRLNQDGKVQLSVQGLGDIALNDVKEISG